MIGRAEPLSRLAGLIGRAPAGGGAILITGETGVGKSTLIGAGADVARTAGFRVLTCSGVEGETQIGLAGLHELFRLIIDRAEILPVEDRDVLFSVFGLGPRVEVDRLRLSAAVIGLLTALAAEQPLMIVLDDAHWMDQPTLSMIAFLVQRVSAAPIVMVVGRRPDGATALDPIGLDEIVLDRLSDTDARALVSRRHPDIPGHALRQVLDEAEGNPLALIELAREAASGRPDAGGTSLRARLERGYAAQLAALSPAAQDLLLLTAAANTSSIPELTGAAGRLGLDLGALAEAERSGLVALTGGSVTFRHPLIRSAVYQAAGLHRRVRTHEALAETLTERGQPSQAAWHRAAATIGYDDTVAQELEDAAAGDRLRGLHGAAMRALERAAALTRDPDGQARRLILASEAARLAGMATESRRLADRAGEVATDTLVRGDLAVIRLGIDLNSGIRACTPEELYDQGRATAAEGHLDMALQLLGAAAYLSRRRATPQAARDRIGRALAELGVPATDPRVAISLCVLAPERHAPAVLPLVHAYAAGLDQLPVAFRSGLGSAAQALQDWPLAARFFTAAAEGFRERGYLADSVAVRAEVAFTLGVRGRLDEALAEAERVRDAARDGDLAIAAGLAEAVIAHTHAWQGRPVTAADPIRGDIDALRAWAIGLSALAGGDLPAAYEALCGTAVQADVAMAAIADLAEAAAGTGHADAVRAAVDDAGRLAEATGSPLIRALAHRARAVLGEDPEANFRLAVAGEYPLQTARTHLLYGEWLHRHSRDAAARPVLTSAAAVFERSGAHPWLARAERALRPV
ncbi:AAA family ATPase [Actinoplanes sp. L3-i22]|uniref:ATP-binding protein n=1 Tax=Actinoplanes sp. L3-i22 TaxID=2836373 RepID=UPI001C74C3A6|nr:AAA family ATPase [Actinoplanes sp. L3-i22]BCY08378.1 transcriptional regulator [Actinoplanes sp. L3-i22]